MKIAYYRLHVNKMRTYWKYIINDDESAELLGQSICLLMESMWAHETDPDDGVLDPKLAEWFKEVRTYLILKFPDFYKETLKYIDRIGIG